ncbi:MAG: UDP-N-acetylmuramoyl-L-alanine--D-glutamate ligase [Spirochaetia bacterium]
MKQGESYAGSRVTVMGLGLHGGGVSAARYFARHGAVVTVTDLRDERELASSVEVLEDVPVRFVLGTHEEADFKDADIVIKNPAVPRTSPYLALARRIETDISVFLTQSSTRLVAVTGSKGKSSTSAAVHHILSTTIGNSYLGGNITNSPLEFAEEAGPHSTVVLELSSFQLGDLEMTPGGIAALRPDIAMITSIFPDHLNYYRSMAEYVADKRLIYAGQGPGDWTIARDDEYGTSFLAETPARRAVLCDHPIAGAGNAWEAYAYLDGHIGFACTEGHDEDVVPEHLLVAGIHMRRNLLAAALAARLLGVDASAAREAVSSFPGIGHRLEHVRERNGIHFYNDSAATIPEAALEAVSAFEAPVHLIAGGSVKNIDLGLFGRISERVARVYLLQGSAAAAISSVTHEHKLAGPFDSLASALHAAVSNARRGDVVILSPGCASFGMFQNEFDRGRQFRDLVANLE